MIVEADDDGSGTIDFEEFLTLMYKRLSELDVREELLEAFKVYDREGTGLINIDEIKKILMKMGDQTTKEEIDEVLQDLDPQGFKMLKYEDYVKENWDFWGKDTKHY